MLFYSKFLFHQCLKLNLLLKCVKTWFSIQKCRVWKEQVRKWVIQNGTVYCLGSIKPEGSEVLASHFVLLRFSSLKMYWDSLWLRSPPFLFSGCFLSGLCWTQEQTRAQESAVVIQQECVSGNGESTVEGSGGRKLFLFFPAYTKLTWLSAKAGGQGWQRMVSDIPTFPRDTTADTSVGFLPLTSTEAKYERNGEWKNKQDDLKSMGRAAR